jgi:hypothetical protein
MLKKLLILSLCFLMIALTVIAPAKAIIPGPGTQVAIVPDPSSTHGGTLPSTDAAFDNFTFTNVPWAEVTAANLTNFDIVVLLIDGGASNPPLNASQSSELIDWVGNGGKLIIYDSEEQLPDDYYSWLPYAFNTSAPGAVGGFQGTILYMELNTLGRDDDPVSPYYINSTVDYIFNHWDDAIGDANVFDTFDSHWCGDIEIINVADEIGWVHAYAVYGDGLLIYNGFDIDFLGSGTVPGPEDINALAKIWLLELQQPWGDDYNLPCARTVVDDGAVGGEILATNTLQMLIPYLLILAPAIAATAGILYKKKTP